MPLKVSDGIAAYIDDFQKSDAAQFKGKSKKERRDMAIAAYLTAKRGGKPQEENVKSADRKPEVYTKPDGKRGVRMVPVDREVVKTEALDAKDKPTVKKIIKKLKGASQAHAGQAKDLEKAMETEAKVNELSPATMNRYKKAASRDQYNTSSEIGRISSTPGLGKKYKDKTIGDAEKRREKRVRGLNLATKRSGTPGMQKEETNFAVSIEGLPTMFMSADSPGMLKQTLRKIVKQPSMIKAVKRVTDAKVKKTFRLKAQGREEEE